MAGDYESWREMTVSFLGVDSGLRSIHRLTYIEVGFPMLAEYVGN